jgi:hypothetical protein
MSKSKSLYFEVYLTNGKKKNLFIGNTGNIDAEDERNITLIEIWIEEQLGRLLKDPEYFPNKIVKVNRVVRAQWIKNEDEQIYISKILFL